MMCIHRITYLVYFFFNYTATTEIYTDCHTLSLHDALPIYSDEQTVAVDAVASEHLARVDMPKRLQQFMQQFKVAFGATHSRIVLRVSASDRKSTRLNSSH